MASLYVLCGAILLIAFEIEHYSFGTNESYILIHAHEFEAK
jgi:hypothetical protein